MLSVKRAPKTRLLTLILFAIGNLASAESPQATEFFGSERGTILNPPEHGSRQQLEKFFAKYDLALEVLEGTHHVDKCLIFSYCPYSGRNTSYLYAYASFSGREPDRQYEFRVFQKINRVDKMSVLGTNDGWKISCGSNPVLIIPYETLNR